MDWNFVSYSDPGLPHESSSLLYNYNYNLDHHFPAVSETTKKAVVAEATAEAEVEGVVGIGVVVDDQKKKKKRLSKHQLESLERSFEEEVKLDPDRKMKLSKELGIQQRQIAIWFQNRRARWKAKQLQHLYDTLKQQFDIISTQKHNLQQEVMKLRSMLGEQAKRNQGSIAYTDVSASGEETVESASVGVRSCNDYMYNNNVEDLSQISASAPPLWWGDEAANHLPSYP